MSSASAPSRAASMTCPSSCSPRDTNARKASSSSAIRMEAIVLLHGVRLGFAGRRPAFHRSRQLARPACNQALERKPLNALLLGVLFEHADEGKLPVSMRDVHAVADDEQVGTGEARKVGVDR